MTQGVGGGERGVSRVIARRTSALALIVGLGGAVLTGCGKGGGDADGPPTVAEVHAQLAAASPHQWLFRSDHLQRFQSLRTALKDLLKHGTTLDPVRFSQLCGELKAAALAAQQVDERPPGSIATLWDEAIRLSLRIADEGQTAAEVVEIRGIGRASFRYTQRMPSQERRAWEDLGAVQLFVAS